MSRSIHRHVRPGRALRAESGQRHATEMRLRRQVRQQQALARLSQLAQAGPLQPLFRTAAETVRDALAAHLVLIGRLTEDRAVQTLSHSVRCSPALPAVFEPNTAPAVSAAFNRLVEVRDFSAPDTPPSGVAVALRSGLAAPILSREAVFGCVAVYGRRPRAFGRGDADFLRAVCSLLGAAVERTQAKDELGASEARHRAIIETAAEGIAIVDAGSRILYSNRRLSEMLGYAPVELVGRASTEFIERGVRVQRPRIVLGHGHLHEVDIPFRRKDGTLLWAQVSASPLPGCQDQPPRVLAVFRDVTARRQTEDRLRESEARAKEAVELIERLTADAIITADGQGRILSWNDGAARMFGWTREESLNLGMDIVPPELRDETFALFRRIVQTGETISGETIRLTKSGRPLTVLGSWSRIRQHDGRPGLLAIFKDISDLRHADEQLNEQARLLALMQERERIAMDLHDGVIQSLYGVVLSLGACRRAARLSESSWKSLGEAIQQLNLCISDLRTYIYQLRSPDLDEPNFTADLNQLIDTVKMHTSAAISVDADAGVQQAIEKNDANNLLQVAREAVSNAVRHAAPSTLKVRLRRRAGYVSLLVADDGRGFDLSDARNHAGYGLANMARRAKALKARLKLRTRPGQGTVVWLRMPVRAKATRRRETRRVAS